MTWFEWEAVFIGSANGFRYREGRTTLTVRPDFGNVRWYWSVHWAKHNAPPKRRPDGSFFVPNPLPAAYAWGIEDTEEAAKAAATKAFSKGRPTPGGV